MIGVNFRMMFNAFWTHKFETGSFCAEIGDGFVFVFVAGDVVGEVGLHILNGKGLVHGSYKVIIEFESLEISSKISLPILPSPLATW